MIKCNEVINELEAYRKGNVSGELKTLIASHLNTCPACRSELKALEQLDTLLDAYTVAPASANLQAGFNKKLSELEKAHHFHLSCPPDRTMPVVRAGRRVGLLASAAVVMVAALVWLVSPFNGSGTDTDLPDWLGQAGIIANIELLEDMETAQLADIVQDYELVVAMPEIMDADLNGE